MRCYKNRDGYVNCFSPAMAVQLAGDEGSDASKEEPTGPFGVPLSLQYSYTMLACAIAAAQLLFLLIICCYVKWIKANQKKKVAKERARFYRFFFELHQLMPSEAQVDEELRDEELQWNRYLEEYKRNNPNRSSGHANSKFNMMNKDGISMQQSIQLKMEFSIKYKF